MARTESKGRTGSNTRKKAHRNKTIKRGGVKKIDTISHKPFLQITPIIHKPQTKKLHSAMPLYKEEKRREKTKNKELDTWFEERLKRLKETISSPLSLVAPLSVTSHVFDAAPATKPALDAARVRLFGELERIVGERVRERQAESEITALLERKEQLKKEYRNADKRLNVKYTIPLEVIQSIAITKRISTEEINKIDAILEGRPGYQSNNNFVIHPNFVTLGVGASKIASIREQPNGWAYLSVAPDENGRVPRSRKLKMQWEEDFDVSLLLYRVCDSFFPNVERVLTTPNRYSFRKELCEKIVSGKRLPNGTIRDGNLTYPVLRHIIDRSIELIDNYGLFTLDLKPSNMGLKNGLGVFIDFSLDSSFLINPDCDTSDYKSVMILILLVFCYNFCLGDPTKLSREHLRELAREFVTGITYRRLCEPDYRIENDPCLDLTFNRGIAPSFDTYKRPETILRHYSRRDDKSSNFQEIIEYFFS